MIDEKKWNLLNAMALCYGTEDYHTNPNLSFDYTDGVKRFCETAEAYWLLDLVESVVKTKPEMDKILVGIKLKVKKDNTAIITFKDGVKILYKQNIPFTDCPDGEWKFFYKDKVFFWCDEY